MIVNLLTSSRVFSTTLPSKVKGKYWLTDLDDQGSLRQLISIEAVNDSWVLRSNKQTKIKASDDSFLKEAVLDKTSYLNLQVGDQAARIILFTEDLDPSRQTLKKILATGGFVFSIGRSDDNNFVYNNRFVSGHHARLAYDGYGWSVQDLGSMNGTYVNGYRIESVQLEPGALIYIMGLKIVIGKNYLAVNNPDLNLTIKSDALHMYKQQQRIFAENEFELADKSYFYRAPRFRREIELQKISIDPPPPMHKQDKLPLALVLGPPITMGMTSISMGAVAITSALARGGGIGQAMPSLLMSLGMLSGTILWPLLTKSHEKKEKEKTEKLRQTKYLAYLNELNAEIKDVAQKQRDILFENLVSLEECVERIVKCKENLWERIIWQEDFLRLRLGHGELPMQLEVNYQPKKFSMDDDGLQEAMLSLAMEPKVLTDVPISVDLAGSLAVGLFGAKAATDNLLKAMLLQMISLHSYDELKLILIVEAADVPNWDFVKYIPHFWDDEKSIRFFAESDVEVKELSAYLETILLSRDNSNQPDANDFSPYYVIMATNSRLLKKCEVVWQLLKLKENIGATILLTSENYADFPKETETIVSINGDKAEIFDKDDTSGSQLSLNLNLTDTAVLAGVARKIANIEMDLASQSYMLPTVLTFLEMFNVGKVEHLNSLTRWKENNATKTLETPVGVDTDGDAFKLDLHEKFHGPHGLIAGMTGSGKSEFIITYILSLAVNYHPDEVAFILIDYKGGGLAGAFADDVRKIRLPHLAGTITNLDGSAIKRSLVSIQSELRRRQTIFNEARKISNEGTMDIYKYQQLYRDKAVVEPLPHLFIISDEFAELKMQQPDFMDQLISTARIGRSLGIHLILATQKPSGVVDDQIWSNSKFRISLKVQDKQDSQEMIKCPDAAEITQTGRFYLQVGFNELFALGHSAWCGADYSPADEVKKAVDNSIQLIDNLGRTIISAKPAERKKESGTVKQLVAIVKYLSDLAEEENLHSRSLWLEPLAEVIYLSDLAVKYPQNKEKFVLNPLVGELDDPYNQRQAALNIPFSSSGNCILYGSTGSGKTSFLTTLCYSLLQNHPVEELSLYILDFAAETLKVFARAPQVGGVITSADEEKNINFFKMLRQIMEQRRALFADYGGEYASYCRSGAGALPSILVVLNNFEGFAEQFENLLDEFALLSRDGTKYGIYFIITASNTNAVRYRVLQNFKMLLTLQLNDATDYPVVVGKTDGLVPAAVKGRGLVALDKPYEFQTAICLDADDLLANLRNFSQELAQSSKGRARQIPVLPKSVDYAYFRDSLTSLAELPLGVAKNDLAFVSLDLEKRVIFPVTSQDMSGMAVFLIELVRILADLAQLTVLDLAQLLPDSSKHEPAVIVDEIFAEMVERNNTYKDAGQDLAALSGFSNRTYLIIGLNRFFEQLSTESKDKMHTLLAKGEAIYKMHFIICDTVADLNSLSYEEWYKRHVANNDGIWLGDGVADQYLLKLNKVTNDLYRDVEPGYGYMIRRGRAVYSKLLGAIEE